MNTFIVTAIATIVSATVIAGVFYVAIDNATKEDTSAITNTTGKIVKLDPLKVDSGETIDRRNMPLANCKKTVENRMVKNYKGLTSRILVNTDVVYKVRVLMPKDAITLTCFDSEIITTKHNYL